MSGHFLTVGFRLILAAGLWHAFALPRDVFGAHASEVPGSENLMICDQPPPIVPINSSSNSTSMFHPPIHPLSDVLRIIVVLNNKILWLFHCRVVRQCLMRHFRPVHRKPPPMGPMPSPCVPVPIFVLLLTGAQNEVGE